MHHRILTEKYSRTDLYLCNHCKTKLSLAHNAERHMEGSGKQDFRES